MRVYISSVEGSDMPQVVVDSDDGTSPDEVAELYLKTIEILKAGIKK